MDDTGTSLVRLRRRQLRFDWLESRVVPATELTLATFNTVGNPIGNVVADSAGDLFGTTIGGGDFGYGEIFEIVHGQNSVTSVASFNGSNGQTPNPQLIIDSSGDLFGTTESGGAGQQGTVFELAHGSNSIADLASFNGGNGKLPNSELVRDSSGNLFGTTENGGSAGYGTVFEIAAGGAFSTIVNCDASDPNPFGSLVFDGAGDLLGTVQSNVFMIPHGTNQIQIVPALQNIGVGNLSTDSAGNIYAIGGAGANNDGEIVEISPSFSVQRISFNGTNGKYPQSTMYIDGQGNVFGTTEYGGTSNEGTIFEIAAGSGTIRALVSFKGTNGSAPQGALIADAAGDLFGTTQTGGTDGVGTVFELNRGASAVTTVASFEAPAAGTMPSSPLIEDTKGDFFGTTSQGGAYGKGTVYEVVPGNGTPITLASFNGTNGANPYTGLYEDATGDLFGTTDSGGSSNLGVIFEILHGSSTITPLVNFNGSDGQYPSALVGDSSGNIFGTTQAGSNSDGTVFEIAAGTNTVSTFATFDPTNDGTPLGKVVFDNNGNLFVASTLGDGAIFEIAHGTNTITQIATFRSDSPLNPQLGVFDPTTGNIYGVTHLGGTGQLGTLFEVPSGTHSVVTLVNFDNTNGQQPLPDLAVDSQGDVFGTTRAGVGYGYVFEIVHATGALVSVYPFEPPYGDFPESGVIIDGNGNLFGAANRGGPLGLVNGGGVIYEIAAGTPPTVAMTSPLPGAFEGSDPTLTANASGSSIANVQFQVSSDGGSTWVNAGSAATTSPCSIAYPLAAGSYLARAIATDGNGLATTSAPVAFFVDQPPQFVGGSSLSVAVPEGTTAVAHVAVTASDSALRYAIVGGDDASKFQIDSSTGVLTFLAAPSFNDPTDADGDNVYRVIVQATDGPLSASEAISVQVNDVTGYGSIYANASWSGTAVGVLIADADPTVAGDQPAIFGTSAFATLTEALNAANSAGIVDVFAGNFPESVSLTGTTTLRLHGNVSTGSIRSDSSTTIDLQSFTLSVDSGTGEETLAGSIIGSGSFDMIGSGTLVFDGSNTYTGGTTVSSGLLLVDGSTSSLSAVLVAAGAELGGTGTIGGAVSSLGVVVPGGPGSVGTLTIDGNLNLDPDVASSPGALWIDLVGGGPNSTLHLGGTADLTGATLVLTTSGDFADGETFDIAQLAGSFPGRIGIFTGGATLTVGGIPFGINYAGGMTGNDVVLTALDSGTAGPSIVNRVLNGGAPYVDSTVAGNQHSMVEDVVYSFSQAVGLSTSNFSLTGINGTTSAPNVALASSNDGTVWTVSFTGDGVNAATNSIGDGEFQLVLSGISGMASNTYDFFRLLGDMDGNGTVDSSDFNIFISSFLRGTTDPAYLGADDLDGNHTVDSSDFNILVSNFLRLLPNTTLLN